MQYLTLIVSLVYIYIYIYIYALTSVHIGNDVVQCVDSVKDLGVHVDKNLKFMTHINKTVAKAQIRVGLRL